MSTALAAAVARHTFSRTVCMTLMTESRWAAEGPVGPPPAPAPSCARGALRRMVERIAIRRSTSGLLSACSLLSIRRNNVVDLSNAQVQRRSDARAIWQRDRASECIPCRRIRMLRMPRPCMPGPPPHPSNCPPLPGPHRPGPSAPRPAPSWARATPADRVAAVHTISIARMAFIDVPLQ